MLPTKCEACGVQTNDLHKYTIYRVKLEPPCQGSNCWDSCRCPSEQVFFSTREAAEAFIVEYNANVPQKDKDGYYTWHTPRAEKDIDEYVLDSKDTLGMY